MYLGAFHQVKFILYVHKIKLASLIIDIIYNSYNFNHANQDHLLTRPTHWRTDANLYPLKRQLTKASEPLFDLEGGAQCQI